MNRKNVNYIAVKLKKAGFECFLVGGAVRDKLLGKTPKDFDLASNATPADIKKVFAGEQILEIGEAFGITAIVLDNEPYEIAQYRKDIGSDGRHPDKIELVRDIEIDLARRDFTMNAIAECPLIGKIRDPFCGVLDIQDKIIQFVGDPAARIVEDKLRILRAFRFMSQLDFTIEPDSLDAIKTWINISPDFSSVSQERITAEFSKIMTGKNAMETIKLMAEIGLLWLIIPELSPLCEEHDNEYHTETMELNGISSTSILVHVLYVIKFATEHLLNREIETDTEKLIIMLAAIFHDIGKPLCRSMKANGKSRFHEHDRVGAEITEQILTRMRFSNEIIKGVTTLVKKHMNAHDLPKMKKTHKIRRLLASEFFNLLVILSYADTMGTAGNNGVPNEKDADNFHVCVCNYISKYGKVLPAPLITGETLIQLGFTPGPEFKERLYKAMNFQLDGETNIEKLINYTKGLVLKS